MDFLNIFLNVSLPTGVWASIINAFENGVGNYLLAIVLITLIVKVLFSPLDLFNRKISKKQTDMQAKIKPQMEELQKKFGHDRNLLNQKTQELYKKNGMSMGGSCLFMLVFMAVNMTIFFTLFSSLNSFADYKINQQYLSMKNSYANVLNLTNEYINDSTIKDKVLFDENKNITFEIVDDQFVAFDENKNEIYSIEYVDDFSTMKDSGKNQPAGDITAIVENFDREKDFTKIKEVTINSEDKEVISYYYITTSKITENDGKYVLSEEVDVFEFVSNDKVIKSLIEEKNKISDENIKNSVQNLALSEVYETYEITQKENSFLWIGSIWVADSPFKNSVFTFEEYKNEIGAGNVSAEEEVIYNAFMTDLREEKGRVNGYFILAIVSVGVSCLSIFLSQYNGKRKKAKQQFVSPNQPPQPLQPQKTNKVMYIIMPLITGIFAILYNSVFAIYLLVSQAISAGLAPLNNLLIKQLEKIKRKKKPKEEVVDYRRK